MTISTLPRSMLQQCQHVINKPTSQQRFNKPTNNANRIYSHYVLFPIPDILEVQKTVDCQFGKVEKVSLSRNTFLLMPCAVVYTYVTQLVCTWAIFNVSGSLPSQILMAQRWPISLTNSRVKWFILSSIQGYSWFILYYPIYVFAIFIYNRSHCHYYRLVFLFTSDNPLKDNDLISFIWNGTWFIPIKFIPQFLRILLPGNFYMESR